MAKKRRRQLHSIGDLVRDVADDAKDLLKNEIKSATRRDKRDTDASPRQSSESREDGARPARRNEDLDDLQDEIRALTAKVSELSAEKEGEKEGEREGEREGKP